MARLNESRQHGVAAVEFAILLVPLLLMVFGITELGRAFYQYNTLVKATRSAARYKTMSGPGALETETRCLAVHGDTGCTGSPLLDGLTVNMVSIDYATNIATGSGGINLVKVTINDPNASERFSFISVVPFVIPDITFGPVATTMRGPA
ncbi:MAG: pilus assembly protein [Gammaproteobacteria bacterium]|nr:pilus assembly protein [Gammaproteobacteria bacterium]MBU1406540.1 pilus assembly protein [Gammaproteobacteria bacterium]MBU1530848.1 pilus assembly protein [Gammaproteobacteria bacterium]